MKKILIGICGIGNGHLNRQICVIEELLKSNNQIVVATQKEKIDVLKERFPKINILEVNIPWITCTNNGIDYVDSLSKYINSSKNQYKLFFEFSINVEKLFNGHPDIVITDYEPNVAQYAYSASLPLICMEQQSKFLYLDEIDIENNSIKEEKYRLNYFFPKYDKKIISSFFPIDVKDENIYVVPPIIPAIKKNNDKNNQVIVYFSPYSDSENYLKILNIIKDYSNYIFKIYSNKDLKQYQNFFKYKNLSFYNFNSNFKDELCSSSALITTCGHQLVSEAISINIPLCVFPLETYEQKYNASMIEKYGIGVYIKDYEKIELDAFFKNINNYYDNILKLKQNYYKVRWQDVLKDIIDGL